MSGRGGGCYPSPSLHHLSIHNLPTWRLHSVSRVIRRKNNKQLLSYMCLKCSVVLQHLSNIFREDIPPSIGQAQSGQDYSFVALGRIFTAGPLATLCMHKITAQIRCSVKLCGKQWHLNYLESKTVNKQGESERVHQLKLQYVTFFECFLVEICSKIYLNVERNSQSLLWTRLIEKYCQQGRDIHFYKFLNEAHPSYKSKNFSYFFFISNFGVFSFINFITAITWSTGQSETDASWSHHQITAEQGEGE